MFFDRKTPFILSLEIGVSLPKKGLWVICAKDPFCTIFALFSGVEFITPFTAFVS